MFDAAPSIAPPIDRVFLRSVIDGARFEGSIAMLRPAAGVELRGR